MPMVYWNTAGTATVELTIPRNPEELVKKTVKGCFVKKDANVKPFVEEYIDRSADKDKYERSDYLFYCCVSDFSEVVTRAVIYYEEPSRGWRGPTQKRKACTVNDPLIITFDGHFFLCCESEDLNKSKFLAECSKEVRINQALGTRNKFFGLGMDASYLMFISFETQQLQNHIYKVNDRRVFNKLLETGPLLLDDTKTIVASYRKLPEENQRIEINIFGNQDAAVKNTKSGRRHSTPSLRCEGDVPEDKQKNVTQIQAQVTWLVMKKEKPGSKMQREPEGIPPDAPEDPAPAPLPPDPQEGNHQLDAAVKNTKSGRRHSTPSLRCEGDVPEDKQKNVTQIQAQVTWLVMKKEKPGSKMQLMASSTSWSTETDEKINYTKLCRLLVDGGTQAVRSVFDGIHPPSSLKAILNANKTTLQKLKKPRGKVLNNEQWDQLYPPSGNDPRSEDFDITLLFVLLRNICGLTAPATGWDALPPVTDPSKEANLARIKYYRNNAIAHKPSTEISDANFKQLWQDISSALVSLGLSQDEIDDLKSAPLGKKDYNQLLDDWYISDKDIKTQLEKVNSDMADMTEKLDDMMCMMTHKMDHRIKELAFSNFRPEIDTKCKLFHPNTRQWILDQVKSHVDSDQPDSCIMLVTAGPGMGKSTLAAKICQTYTDQACLAGCHFFQFSNSTRNKPRLMLQSIAQQICDTLPGYQNVLESKLQRDLGKEISKMNCEELLTILFEEPLCNVDQPKSNLVIVIDALDECSLDRKDELLKALRKKLSCFPSWLRFVLTSRPSTNTSALGPIVTVKMETEDQANIKDLEVFFSFELKALYPQGNNHDNADLIDRLVKMTKGLLLVAFFIIEYLKRENVALPEKILELFPNGISSVYENYFSRLKEVLLPYMSNKERFYKMLEAVVATNNPLPKDMAYNILFLKSEHEFPRQEKKTRKDALNTLHWLFPVEGNRVTAFHKSVIDWLTLEEDQEHDFSVRVEDGEEVLASQCNDVLSDIRNGEKDLDKPLDLTDSETYALEFLAYAVKEDLAVVKADKYGFFSNIYILSALIIETTFQSDAIEIPEGIIPSSLLDILRNMGIYYRLIMRHARSCGFFRPYPFGFCLALLLQASHTEGGSAESLTPKPLDALKKHRLPYYDKSLLLTSDGCLSSFQQCLLNLCKDGFIAVFHMSRPSSPTTTVYKVQLDGRVHVRREFISERKLIAASPNVNFVVAFEENGRKIDLLDATTLEVVRQCESPHNAIETCHVFGDDQGFSIVIKGRHDNKVYVIEGQTGRVRNTITVDRGSKVIAVSCQGHIVVSRKWKSKRKEEIILFTNKDGELVELMNWENWAQGYFAFRNVFLYHHDRGEERIPLHPLAGTMCHCAMFPKCEVYVDVHVSGDGRLLAYHYKDSVFIFNTSDGSLFKRCPLGTWSESRLVILFVSSSYLVIIDEQTMFVINVKTDEFEHTIYLPRKVGLDDIIHYLLLPEEDGTSFNLIVFHQKSESNTFEVSRLVFHNLNLQGLQ